MADPLQHVLRPPIPWRPADERTECGLPANSYPTWSRDELIVQAKRLGKTRTYMICCVTCLDTAQRHPTWDEDPVSFIGRLVTHRWGKNTAERDRFTRELRAMAALVAAHRDEFDAAVSGLADTTDLDERRKARSEGGRRG